MLSFRIKKFYIFLILSSTMSILLFNFGFNHLVALTNTTSGIAYLNSKIKLSARPSVEFRFSLTNDKHFGVSHISMKQNIQNNYHTSGQFVNSRTEGIRRFFNLLLKFLRFCSQVNQQCIPSFFSWVWGLITNPFTWIVGFILLICVYKS